MNLLNNYLNSDTCVRLYLALYNKELWPIILEDEIADWELEAIIRKGTSITCEIFSSAHTWVGNAYIDFMELESVLFTDFNDGNRYFFYIKDFINLLKQEKAKMMEFDVNKSGLKVDLQNYE